MMKRGAGDGARGGYSDDDDLFEPPCGPAKRPSTNNTLAARAKWTAPSVKELYDSIITAVSSRERKDYPNVTTALYKVKNRDAGPLKLECHKGAAVCGFAVNVFRKNGESFATMRDCELRHSCDYESDQRLKKQKLARLVPQISPTASH
jgi:hypothetical protein